MVADVMPDQSSTDPLSPGSSKNVATREGNTISFVIAGEVSDKDSRRMFVTAIDYINLITAEDPDAKVNILLDLTTSTSDIRSISSSPRDRGIEFFRNPVIDKIAAFGTNALSRAVLRTMMKLAGITNSRVFAKEQEARAWLAEPSR